jgi:hypothetical protein
MWPLLVSFDGDTPMQHSASETIGHTGRNACRLCAFRGTWVPTGETGRGGATRWLGNDGAVEVRLPADRELDAVRQAQRDLGDLQRVGIDAPPDEALRLLLSASRSIHEVTGFLQSCWHEIEAGAEQQACAVLQQAHLWLQQALLSPPEQLGSTIAPFLPDISSSLEQVSRLPQYYTPRDGVCRTSRSDPTLCVVDDVRLTWYVLSHVPHVHPVALAPSSQHAFRYSDRCGEQSGFSGEVCSVA